MDMQKRMTQANEDYLEAVYELAGGTDKPVRSVDLANKLKVSKASVNKAVSVLKANGYVEQEPYGDVFLTKRGAEYGRAVFRRHLNGRAFCSDPDVFFFRYSNLTFTTKQKVLLAGINHICGNVLFVSDNVAEYKGVDVDALRKIFAKSEFKVLDANYVPGSKSRIVIDLEKAGKPMKLRFDLFTGESNIADIMEIPVNR